MIRIHQVIAEHLRDALQERFPDVPVRIAREPETPAVMALLITIDPPSGLPLADAGLRRQGLLDELGDTLPDGARPLGRDRYDACRRGPGGLHVEAAVACEDDLRDHMGRLVDVAGRPTRGRLHPVEGAQGGGVVLGLVGHAQGSDAVPVLGQPRIDAKAPAGGLPATWSAW